MDRALFQCMSGSFLDSKDESSRSLFSVYRDRSLFSAYRALFQCMLGSFLDSRDKSGGSTRAK